MSHSPQPTSASPSSSRSCASEGHAIAHVDLGGGLGIPYRGLNEIPPHPEEYANLVKRIFANLAVKVVLEPGRMIVGNAGILLSRVIYVKESGPKTFVIIDAAMNDLVRPTLYDAWHDIWPVAEPHPDVAASTVDVVGPVCESGDIMASARALPPLRQGDLLAIMTAGAYGAVQSGTYNSRPLIGEVLVKDERYAIVRPRQTYEDLIGRDRLAPWQPKRIQLRLIGTFWPYLCYYL